MVQSYSQDCMVTRALALALLREALPMLEALDEPVAAAHLLAAIDALRRGAGSSVTPN